MIAYMEAELNEASKQNSKSDNSAVNEEANVDEAIPIYHKKRTKYTKIYKNNDHLY